MSMKPLLTVEEHEDYIKTMDLLAAIARLSTPDPLPRDFEEVEPTSAELWPHDEPVVVVVIVL